MVQKILNGKTLTTKYRDEINIQRHDIISKYSMEKSGNDIWIKESELPSGAGIDSVLREKYGKYILDEVATKELQEEIEGMVNKLLKEQDMELKQQRVVCSN